MSLPIYLHKILEILIDCESTSINSNLKLKYKTKPHLFYSTRKIMKNIFKSPNTLMCPPVVAQPVQKLQRKQTVFCYSRVIFGP